MSTNQTRVFPVIHVTTGELALQNAAVAVSSGAHGVFAISMVGDDEAAMRAARAIKQEHPSLAVGVNLLRHGPRLAVDTSLAAGLDMTWSDQPCTLHGQILARGEEVAEVLATRPEHQFFSAVDFKHQEPDKRPGSSAACAQRLGFIPTTSGPATGVPASAEKLDEIRRIIPRGRLAVASGIRPDNVLRYLPYVTDVLVSTGVSSADDRLQRPALTMLLALVRAFDDAIGRSGKPPTAASATAFDLAQPVLEAALAVLRDKGNNLTTSYLQRMTGLSYQHASRVMQQLEEQGLVTAPAGMGFRQLAPKD